MTDWDHNPYYSPENVGLTIFASVEVPLSYEFDTFMIWKHEDLGYFTWGFDSGCSCPTPFENHVLEDMPKGSLLDAVTDMKAWAVDDYGYKPGDEITKLDSRAYLARRELIKMGMVW